MAQIGIAQGPDRRRDEGWMSDRGFGQHEDDGQEIAAHAILEEARREADLYRRRLEEVQALTNVGSWE